MSDEKVLMFDGFESLRPGPVREVVTGAFREMHAQPADPADNLGGWNRRAGGWGLKADVFECVLAPEGRAIEGAATAHCADNAILAKGDTDWRDVRVESRMQLLPLGDGWGGPAGVLFRFATSQDYLAAVVDEDGRAKILRRMDNAWDVLAGEPIAAEVGQWLDICVEARGSRITARIGPATLSADSGGPVSGCAGFIAARPARFGPLKVTALAGEVDRLEQSRRRREQRLASKGQAFGRPVAWKTCDTSGFGAGRRIRLGDLTGRGGLDFLLLQIAAEKPRPIRAMTAMAASGEVLWQWGEPARPSGPEVSGDGAAQICDIDGDGLNEVVAVLDGELRVLDGATGELKRTGPLPPMSPLPECFKQNVNHWGAGYSDDGPAVKVMSLCLADLAGRGAARDLLLVDNYHTLVAVTPEFEELWRTVTSHGHYPQAYDFDGDGREDVLAGYHHLSPDGELVGRVFLTDHQDAIYVGPLDAEGAGPVKILMAGGEDGLITLTPGYDIRQRIMGHVQRLAVGRFRRDTPGLCVATVLFHGNPGIVSLFDSTGKRLWTRDFPVAGATLQPVNWDGSGVEQMLWSGIRPAGGAAGGLLDGDGELVVPLPDDGGPGFCAFAADFDGDGLDELMLWDYDRIWIYHSDRDPPAGPRYCPERPPLYNMSNFQAYWSRPRWG